MGERDQHLAAGGDRQGLGNALGIMHAHIRKQGAQAVGLEVPLPLDDKDFHKSAPSGSGRIALRPLYRITDFLYHDTKDSINAHRRSCPRRM